MITSVSVCGTGKQAEKYISHLLDNKYHVKGVKGASEGRKKYLKETYGIHGYSTVNELTKKQQPDLLIVASKPGDHREDVISGINNGIKYLIIEKPLATTIQHAQEIRQAILDSQTHASVAYPWRYQKSYHYIRQIIQKKQFGALINVIGNISFPRQIDQGQYPYKWWIHRNMSGGGTIVQVGIHWINFIFGLTGYDYELKKGTVYYNEFHLEDTMTGIWMNTQHQTIELQMTSCIHNEFVSITFQFEHGDLVFFNDCISIYKKNNRHNISKNPLLFISYLTGKSSQLYKVKYFKKTRSFIHDYLNYVLSDIPNAFDPQGLKDSVSDLEKIDEVINC